MADRKAGARLHDFRKDNGITIRLVCREFVRLSRKLGLFKDVFVAIDGSEFKAVNTRDKHYSKAKMKRRLAQIDDSIVRYLGQIESADRGYFKDEEVLACEHDNITTYLPKPYTSRSVKKGLYKKPTLSITRRTTSMSVRPVSA